MTGARQVGKATLLRELLPGATLLNFDLPLERVRIQRDSTLLQPQATVLLLEEVQKLPEIFEVLKAYIDQNPTRRGMYALTGAECAFFDPSIPKTHRPSWPRRL